MKSKKFAFRVEIDGLTVASFRTCSDLQANIAIAEDDEGGSRSPSKELGKVTYDNVTLTKGKTDNRELYDWAKAAIDGDEEGARKDFAVVETDLQGNEIGRWNCFRALPARFKAGDWDATASEVVVEEIELAIEGFLPG